MTSFIPLGRGNTIETLHCYRKRVETGELWYCLDLLMRQTPVTGWLPIMRKVVKGPYAQSDGPDQARDAQFELLTAASCRAAGATPNLPSLTSGS